MTCGFHPMLTTPKDHECIAHLMVFPCGDWYDVENGSWEEQCAGMSDDYWEVCVPRWAYDLWDYPEEEYLFHVLNT